MIGKKQVTLNFKIISYANASKQSDWGFSGRELRVNNARVLDDFAALAVTTTTTHIIH